jgi:uncharacterized protein (DUF849 family)
MTGTFTVTVAPNGARRGKADHLALPITSVEIAETAAACFAAGAGAIHLHVRGKDGRHSLDAGRYRDAIDAVAETAPQMAIQVTTEAAGLYQAAEQYACLQQLQPKAASVSVREMARDIPVAKRLYALAAEAGIALQHILYNAQDVARLRAWFDQGVVAPDMRSVIFVLGQYSPPVLARPGDLSVFLNAMAKMDLDWSLCAFGQHEQACAAAAIQAGGDVRVGFENNTHLPDGSPLRDNAQSVALIVKEGLSLGLTPEQTPSQTLGPTPGQPPKISQKVS